MTIMHIIHIRLLSIYLQIDTCRYPSLLLFPFPV